MEEIWKDIEGYEGLYQVSSLGRVRSLNRVVLRRDGKIYPCKMRYIKGDINKAGYIRVILNSPGGATRISIHRLVAIHFIDNPKAKKQVNHIDGNKINNNARNLEWVSGSENMIHAHSLGLQTNLKGYDNPESKAVVKLSLNNCQIEEYGSMGDAFRATKIPTGNISRACRKGSTAGGFKWMYKTDYYGTKNNR